MKIREKLLDFKRRLSDRKMYSIVIVIIALVASFGIFQYRKASQYRQQLDNQYNRAFFDMTGYVQNVESLLIKAAVSNSPNKTILTLREAWRQANLAQENLVQLPISQTVLANTSRFLTQVGDLSYTLANQYAVGKSISQDQYVTIQKLNTYSKNLRENLANLQDQITVGRMEWGELTKEGTPLFRKTSSALPKTQFENLDKVFQEYPTLIYDGPFSDHMANIKPRAITGNKLSQEEVKKKLPSFFTKSKIKNISSDTSTDTGPISSYGYSVEFDGKDKNEAKVTVTQKGGHPLWMLYNRSIPNKTITMEKAISSAKSFLNAIGYTNMIDTYYLLEDNAATINFAYQDDLVTVYPDLIKVKVALDNGEIIGFDAKNYLVSHTQRNFTSPKITLEQARSKINPKLDIAYSGLAIIPTEYQTEKLVYEFKGKMNKQDFIVYINANTGEEEDILLIVNTPNGILTM